MNQNLAEGWPKDGRRLAKFGRRLAEGWPKAGKKGRPRTMALTLLTPPPEALGDAAFVPPEIESWEAMASAQLSRNLVNGGELAEGEVLALLDRDCFMSDFVRRVFVFRFSASAVAVFDEYGVPIDDKSNFTPGGVQSYAKDDGDHSFSVEWEADDGYYRLPLQLEIFDPLAPPPTPPPLPAPTAMHPPCDNIHPVTALVTRAIGNVLLQHAAAAAQAAAAATVGDPCLDLSARLVPRARLRLPPPVTGATASAATICMRKVHGKADTKQDESVCILWDKLELPIQLHKQVLTPEFIASLRPDLFIRSEDDVCASDRIACAFMARCAKVPEGYFYGAELQGQNDCFLAPTTYEPVPCDTSKLRFPVQMKPGMHVKCRGGVQHVLLNFIIFVEPAQLRYYAVVGSVAELTTPRYYIVPMTRERDENISAAEGSACSDVELEGLRRGLQAFTATLTMTSLRSGKFDFQTVRAHPASPACIPISLHHTLTC